MFFLISFHSPSIDMEFCLKICLFLSFHKFYIEIPGKISQHLFRIGFWKGSTNQCMIRFVRFSFTLHHKRRRYGRGFSPLFCKACRWRELHTLSILVYPNSILFERESHIRRLLFWVKYLVSRCTTSSVSCPLLKSSLPPNRHILTCTSSLIFFPIREYSDHFLILSV